MKHILFSTTLLALLAGGIAEVAAVPAYPKPIEITQSDGSKITIRIIGDEFSHYTLSDEGYTLTGGPDGDYYYATLAADGTLAPTTVKARPVARLDARERAVVSKLRKGIRPTAVNPMKTALRSFDTREPLMTKAPVNGITPPARISDTKTTGKQKWPIILVQYADTKFTVSNPLASISNLLNQDGYSVNGSTGSAWNYYHENSNGQFDPQFEVYGPYTVSKSSSYYAGNGGTQRVPELVVEVCGLADKDINFRNYEENGYIKDVILFFAGYNQAEGGGTSTVWPHCFDVRAAGLYRTFDGVTLAGYGCFSELLGSSGGRITNIGTFCHEFGHIMGWPDFYDTDYIESGGQAPGLEDFSLMCSGSYNNQSRTPPALNILERWMMGWATPEALTASGYYTLPPVTQDKGYLVTAPTTNEYFLVEYRGAGKTKWDNSSYIGGSGMIAYHVDYSAGYASRWAGNTLNNNPNHECMKLVRSVPNTTGTPSRTFFPGSNNVTRLTYESNTLYRSWAGAAPTAGMEEISIANGAVQLTVQGEGALLPDIDFKASASQYSALLTWTDPDFDSWRVTWAPEGSSDIESRSVRQTEIYLEGLTPGTTYNVTITPAPDGEELAQEFSFTTEETTGGKMRIVLPKTELLSDTPVVLAVADCADDAPQLAWYIDGAPSTSGYRRLKAGEHCIMAVITAKDGTKEYLIKYITVK